MLLKAIIIDDERLSIEAIQKILTEFCAEVKIVATTTAPSEGIQLINTHKPDLVFLDIEMPNLNGFDILESVNNRNFEVIFITAYDHYALQAFKVNAIDYILKPVNVKEVIKAINKVAVKKKQQIVGTEKYIKLIEEFRKSKKTKIHLAMQNGVEVVNKLDIVRVTADGRYSRVYLANGSEIFVTKTLKDIETELDEEPFFRVHKSHLVNMNFVRKYNFVSTYQLELIDGTTLEISRRRKDEFIDFITSLS